MENLDASIRILDNQTPVVILIGPPESGKTMLMLRMARFLESKGMTVVPDCNLRSHEDETYIRLCNIFRSIEYSVSHQGAGYIDLMLIKVMDSHGATVLQIIEIPGYELTNEHQGPYRDIWFEQINTISNNKTWVFFLEQGWGQDQKDRDVYARNLCDIRSIVSAKDSFVYLFNKVDRECSLYDRYGRPCKALFFKQIMLQYPEVFKGLTKNNVTYVCFSSGVFHRNKEGMEFWTCGYDWYCSELWNAITNRKSIIGKFISFLKNKNHLGYK